jgi:hypothetical protein
MSFFLNSFAFGPLGSGFVLQVDTARSGATPSDQFQLGLRANTRYNFNIDWGDSSPVETVESNNITTVTHTYPAAGIYNISIAELEIRGFPATQFATVTLDRQKVLNIVSFGTNQFGAIWNSAFSGCTAMNINAQDFANTKTQNVTAFQGAFNNCRSLTSFPLIDTSKGSNFIFTWRNCVSLSSFPLIDTRSGTDFFFCWENCPLTSFPLINTGNAFSLSHAWVGCNKLTTFPAISTPKVIDFNSSWLNCSSLTSFPFIDTSNSGFFPSTWRGCISLSASDFPTLNLSKLSVGTDCFNGVKLTTSSYSALLTSLCATNFNLNVPFHGGNSTFNTAGSAARVFLTTPVANGGRGWIINDGGYQAGT